MPGGWGDRHAAHEAIAQARAGDAVTLGNRDGKWLILDRHGRTLGRMARGWSPPQNMRFVSGRAGAVITWRKADNDETYQHLVRRGEWETVLPELGFR